MWQNTGGAQGQDAAAQFQRGAKALKAQQSLRPCGVFQIGMLGLPWGGGPRWLADGAAAVGAHHPRPLACPEAPREGGLRGGAGESAGDAWSPQRAIEAASACEWGRQARLKRAAGAL